MAVSEVSVTTELSRFLARMVGTPLNASVYLGLNVELLGVGEYEGTRLTLIEASCTEDGLRDSILRRLGV